ncbi:MAG: hypothetical protein QXX95_01425 [Nitrososphaerales archaeon]
MTNTTKSILVASLVVIAVIIIVSLGFAFAWNNNSMMSRGWWNGAPMMNAWNNVPMMGNWVGNPITQQAKNNPSLSPDNWFGMGMMGNNMMGYNWNRGPIRGMGPNYMGACPGTVWYQPTISAERLSIDKVKEKLESYLNSLEGNFALHEIMEFQNNFYAIVVEKDTGIGAFELLVHPYTGFIMPEPGPNMMWNIKYGMHNMMGYTITTTMNIDSEQAKKLALTYLQQYFSNVEVEEPIQFYGYYTLDFKVSGETYGMLSVNGYTGQVWYHSWHGKFIQELEIEE